MTWVAVREEEERRKREEKEREEAEYAERVRKLQEIEERKRQREIEIEQKQRMKDEEVHRQVRVHPCVTSHLPYRLFRTFNHLKFLNSAIVDERYGQSRPKASGRRRTSVATRWRPRGNVGRARSSLATAEGRRLARARESEGRKLEQAEVQLCYLLILPQQHVDVFELKVHVFYRCFD